MILLKFKTREDKVKWILLSCAQGDGQEPAQ